MKQRQSAMTLIGKYFGPIGGMAQGKVPYDAEDRPAQRGVPATTWRSMPWDGFDASTKDVKDVKTRALPAIWEQPGKFKEAVDRLENEIAQAASR